MRFVRFSVAVAVVTAGMLGALLVGGPRAAGAADTSAAATSSVAVVPGFAEEALAQINAARRRNGLRPLRLAAGLGKAATGHARAMGRNGFFSHSFAGRGASSRIAQYYDGSPVGEVILWRAPGITAAQAVAAWLQSPSHRALLLHPAFRKMGAAAVKATNAPGVYHGLDVTIVVADFGARSG
jgi:uncharacterized protein YkwD